jgi:hypothetical protein
VQKQQAREGKRQEMFSAQACVVIVSRFVRPALLLILDLCVFVRARVVNLAVAWAYQIREPGYTHRISDLVSTLRVGPDDPNPSIRLSTIIGGP